jgi:hypothetical protein
MAKTKIRVISRQIIYALIGAVLTIAYFSNTVSANQIAPRKVTIGSSVASADTTYAFEFTVPQNTVLQSASFTACTTPSGACTPAPGFSASASTLTSQPVNLGDASGWTVNTATANSLRLSKSGNVAAPTGTQTVSFSNVHNPSATNSTFYMRIATYSDASWTTSVDTGVVATSTAGQITVTASVDETLTFTLGTATVALGTLSTSATGTGTSSMTVATNANAGYSVAYSGSTLTSGSNTITAMAGGASVMDSKQFGINLMDNTTPNIGTNVSGTGSGTPSAGYGTADSFKFNTAGEVIASAAAPTNSNTFTASYIANINGATAAGAYQTVLTYTATANF